MASKIKYEIDPHNRLTIGGPYKFRRVVDGTFGLGEGNSLIYHVKQSDGMETPQQVKLSGAWSLNSDHHLVLTLDKWNNQVEGDKLVIATEIVDVSGNELAFTAGTRDSDGTEHVTMLKMSGVWKADEHNRLTFSVQKSGGAADELVLRGTWTVNKKHEIEYYYRRGLHAAKTGIRFSGHWGIVGNNRLSYILSEDSVSKFDFAATLEKIMRNSIEATVGIGVSPIKKKIILAGRWEVGEGADAFFQIKYGGGKTFPISVKLIKTLPSGEAYVRFERTGNEFQVLGGLGVKF